MKKEEKAIKKIIEAIKELGEKATVESDENSLIITVKGDWRNGKPVSRPK